MLICQICGHQFTSGESCPHCGGVQLKPVESAPIEEVEPETTGEDETEEEEE